MSIVKKTIRGLVASIGLTGMVLFLAACPEQKTEEPTVEAPADSMGGMEGMEGMEGAAPANTME